MTVPSNLRSGFLSLGIVIIVGAIGFMVFGGLVLDDARRPAATGWLLRSLLARQRAIVLFDELPVGSGHLLRAGQVQLLVSESGELST